MARPGGVANLREQADMTQSTEHAGEALDVSRLRLDQIEGWYCALCDRRLYFDRSVGVHDVPFGSKVVPIELWACAPDCETTRRPTGRQA